MKHTPETLVILTPAFPADASETNWVPSQQLLVKHLKMQFPHVNIVVLSFLYPYEVKEYRWNNVSVFSFNGMKRKKLEKLKLWLSVWKKIKQVQRSHRLIGIFSFWCGECALVGSYFARRHGLRHYCWICGMDAKKTNWLVRLIRPAAKELVAISDAITDEFYKNHGIKPAHLITNAIDTNMFKSVGTERSIDVMSAGSFSPFKQYDVFVRVVCLLKEKFPQVRAVHCGEGEEQEKERISKLVKDLGLQKTIELQGILSHEEVIAQMQKAKIFLHPSSYEGFSTSCLEALYAGAHVISFCQPMKRQIKHWHIVANEKEMFEKAAALLNEPGTEYSSVLVSNMDTAAREVMKLFGMNREGSAL